MILNDREITRLAEAGMIAPFAEGVARPGVISYGVTSFGYDMRVADEWVQTVLRSGEVIDPKHPHPLTVRDETLYNDSPMMPGWYSHRLEWYVLQPGEFILCRSVEYFDIPEDVVGVVVGKSTYARCGLIVNCTPMEPGWTGQLTIELHNASQHAIKVYANEGIAQVMFFRGERPAVTYADKRGKYQGQTGVTLPRVTR
jgi:dCTP deaminase